MTRTFNNGRSRSQNRNGRLTRSGSLDDQLQEMREQQEEEAKELLPSIRESMGDDAYKKWWGEEVRLSSWGAILEDAKKKAAELQIGDWRDDG